MIFLKGSVPSLKNSKVKTNRGIFHSPTVAKYIRTLGIQHFNSRKKEVKGYVDPNKPNEIEKLRSKFEEMLKDKGNPIFIGYFHIRKTKALFDFSNSVELIQDLLTSHNIIEDDSVKYVFPIVMSRNGELPNENNLRTEEWYAVDKENHGVWIKFF